MTKTCRICGLVKPVTEFWKRLACKDGFGLYCKECSKKKAHDYHIKNPAVKKNSHLKDTFEITLEQYDQILDSQGGVCAICGGINQDGRRLAVDHNHKTEKIRGLLCGVCNTRLGILEIEEWCSLAYNYLRLHG